MHAGEAGRAIRYFQCCDIEHGFPQWNVVFVGDRFANRQECLAFVVGWIGLVILELLLDEGFQRMRTAANKGLAHCNTERAMLYEKDERNLPMRVKNGL